MKLRKIRVPEFIHADDFGTFKIHDVEILFDPNEGDITPESFDQASDTYFLSDKEIERLTRLAAQRFLDENAADVLRGTRKFTSQEVNAAKSFFKVSGAELGDLIGLDKSSISRILSGAHAQELQKDNAMLLLERLKDELEHPGKCKILLSHLRAQNGASSAPVQLCFPALHIGEYFVRRFNLLESPVTHLKLQKLLYYAQGIGFARANIKLIREPFLAWEHGPVVREIYDRYRGNGKAPLAPNEALDITAVSGNETVMAVLEETVSLYGLYDPWYLRERTHQESPWAETKRNEPISDDKMIGFFRKALV